MAWTAVTNAVKWVCTSAYRKVSPPTDVPYAYAWYDATKILYRLYLEDGLESDRDAEREYKVNVAKDKGDQRRWWTFADYTYKANAKTGKIEKNYLTDANLTSANNYGRTGNPGKWRAEYDPVRPWHVTIRPSTSPSCVLPTYY